MDTKCNSLSGAPGGHLDQTSHSEHATEQVFLSKLFLKLSRASTRGQPRKTRAKNLLLESCKADLAFRYLRPTKPSLCARLGRVMQGTLPALTRSRVKISKNEKHSFLNLPMLNPMIPDSDLFLFHPFPIVSCKNEKHGFSKSRAILPPRNVKWPILRPPLVFSRVAGATAASHSAFDSSRALVSKTYFAFQIGGGRNFALQRQTRPAPGANLQFSTREPTKGAVGARSTGESGKNQVIGLGG